MSIFQLSTYYDGHGLTTPGEWVVRTGGVLTGLALVAIAIVAMYFLMISDTHCAGIIIPSALGVSGLIVGGGGIFFCSIFLETSLHELVRFIVTSLKSEKEPSVPLKTEFSADLTNTLGKKTEEEGGL